MARKDKSTSNKDTQNQSILREAVANTYLLMTRTQGVHWNVTGPLFYAVHKLTEEHYGELFAAVDELAERLRALGAFAPSGYEAMLDAATQKPAAKASDAEGMIGELADGHEALARSFRSAIETVEESDDAATADLLTQRVDAHEKAAWMLRAHLA